jgi:hypothetical protein
MHNFLVILAQPSSWSWPYHQKCHFKSINRTHITSLNLSEIIGLGVAC